MRTLFLLCAAPSLTLDPDAEEWTRAHIKNSIACLGADDVVISTGDHCAPDNWIARIAKEHSAPPTLIEFRIDGYRWVNSERTAERWFDPSSPDLRTLADRWRLTQRDALVHALKRAVKADWRVTGLLLDHESDSEIHYLHTTALGVAGIPIPKVTFLPDAPASPPTHTDIVWMDTETTGPSTERHALIEVAGMWTDHSAKEIKKTFEEKIRIPVWAVIEPGSILVNGYSEERWQNARALEPVMEFINGWLPNRFHIGGWNTPFDRRFITANMHRCRLPEPGWTKDPVDALYVARRVLKKTGRVPDAKLTTVCDYYGISNTGAHGAMADVERSRAVYLRMMEGG